MTELRGINDGIKPQELVARVVGKGHSQQAVRSAYWKLLNHDEVQLSPGRLVSLASNGSTLIK